MKKKLGLVVFVSQSGKTTQTFCGATFNEQVEKPIRALLAVEGLVQKIVVVAMCSNDGSPDSEKIFMDYVPEEGLPMHTFTPTSVAVRNHLRDEWEKGHVDTRNISHFFGMPSAIRDATTFIKGQGSEMVVVKVSGQSFPTVEELSTLREVMEATGQDFAILGAEFAPRELLGTFAPREFLCT